MEEKDEEKEEEETEENIITPKEYRIYLMRIINNKQGEEVNIIGKLKINIKIDKIKTIKDIKYYIIDKYKNKKFYPCILSISIPYEDGFICSDVNDTPEKYLEECFPDKIIYVIIDFNKKCDCGFNDLDKLTKREIFEIYIN